MNTLLQSWKTLLIGIAIVALAVAFIMKTINLNEFLGAFALLTGAGFATTKDFNISGK